MNLLAKGSLLLLIGGSACAQVHGIPASATSVTTLGRFNHNIPASVSSLGPLGFSSGTRDRRGFRFRDRLNRSNFGFFPVGIPMYLVDEAPIEREVVREVIAEPRNIEPQKIEITIVDQRAARETPPPKTPEPQASSAPREPEPELSPTILVLQDGTRKELRNYAIMGKDLYDLAENKMFRIPLSAVDVEATVAVNAAVGKQFRLP